MKKLFLLSLALMAMFSTSLWAADVTLYSTDFVNDWSNATLVTNGEATLTTPTYPAEVFVRASGNNKTVSITNKGITQNGNLSVNNAIAGVKVSGINDGTITVRLSHTYSDKKPTFRYYYVDGATAYSSSVSASYSTSTAPSANGGDAVITITGLKNSQCVFYFGAASSSYYSVASITITTPAPDVTHALEWDFAGGSCSATAGTDYTAGGDVAEGATITYPANSTMTKDGYDFAGWSTTATTMPSSDLTITAQWVEHTTQSSDATLSALSVAGCTLSPAFAPATTAYTIALPFYASMPAVGDVTATKNDSYAEDPGVSISDNVITVACEAEDGTKLNYTITVNIADAPTASSSINIEQLVLDYGKSYDIAAALTAAHIAYANLNALDSLAIGDADNSRPDYNETFFGLKIKKSGGYIQMVIPAGETLKVKFGSIAADLKLTINEVAQSDISKSTSVYEHTASGNELIKIATSSDKTVVLKQIMVGEDIKVVRPYLVTMAATTNGTANTNLTKYAKGEEVTVNYEAAEGFELDAISVSGFDDIGVATVVAVSNGKFTMPGSPVTVTVTFKKATTTALDNTEASEIKTVKRLENGMLVIEKDGKTYNVMGQAIR